MRSGETSWEGKDGRRRGGCVNKCLIFFIENGAPFSESRTFISFLNGGVRRNYVSRNSSRGEDHFIFKPVFVYSFCFVFFFGCFFVFFFFLLLFWWCFFFLCFLFLFLLFFF